MYRTDTNPPEPTISWDADGKPLVSISRANLPDAVEASLGRGERNQRTSPAEEKPLPDQDTETSDLGSGSVQGVNASQPVLAAIGDLSMHTSPIIHSTTQSPIQYINKDLPIHTGFDATSGAMPPQDMKRKRQCVEPGPSTTTTTPTPIPLGYYSPMFVGSQPLATGSFNNMQSFAPDGALPPGALPPGQAGTEGYDESVFPYYFGF